MIIVLKQGTTRQEIDYVTNVIVSKGAITVNPMIGDDLTILGLIGDTSRIDPAQLESFRCVERIMKVAEPFKKANRMFHPGPSEVKIGDTVVGGSKLSIMHNVSKKLITLLFISLPPHYLLSKSIKIFLRKYHTPVHIKIQGMCRLSGYKCRHINSKRETMRT